MIILRQKQFGLSPSRIFRGMVSGGRDILGGAKSQKTADGIKRAIMEGEIGSTNRRIERGLNDSLVYKDLIKKELDRTPDPESEAGEFHSNEGIQKRITELQKQRRSSVQDALRIRDRKRELLGQLKEFDNKKYTFGGNAKRVTNDLWNSGPEGKVASIGLGTLAAGTTAGLGYLGYKGVKKLKDKRAARRLQKLEEADQ